MKVRRRIASWRVSVLVIRAPGREIETSYLTTTLTAALRSRLGTEDVIYSVYDMRPAVRETGRLALDRGQTVIAALLFAMIVLNYLDRQALSVVAPIMRQELGITVMQYAWAVNAFLTAYALMYVGSGVVLDRLGYRTGLALFVSCWSAFAALHSLTAGVFSLICFRFLLGLAEPAGFTGAVKTIALRFTPAQRGMATGILGMGTGLGTLIAPPLMVFHSIHFGWRTAFLVAGAAGAI